MRHIIGISGKAEAGKSTAAGFLLAVYPNARSVAFADELKLQALAAWPASATHPWQPYLHLLTDARKIAIANDLKANAAFRTFLQDFGQEKRREDPEYWIRTCFDRHQKLHGWDRALVIPDVRYPNELEAILGARGRVLRVERPGHENRLTPEQRAHSSETALDDFNWDGTPNCGRVYNGGVPVEFLEQTLNATREYLNRRAQGGGY